MKMNNKKSLRPAGTVALMMGATVISKILGMLRSIFLASHYGAGIETDAFASASHIPLTFFDLLFGAALLGCFVPVYNSFGRDENGEITREADDFACIFINIVFLATGLISIIGIIFAPAIIGAFTSGFNDETKTLAIRLLRIMFPLIIFTGCTYTLTGVMQSRGKFMLPACVSMFSNAAIILYFLLFDKRLGENGIYGLAVAYLAAWFVQLITLALPLLKSGFKYKAKIDIKNPSIRKAIHMAPPIMLGSWLTPAGMLIAINFASYFASSGSVTYYDYANNIFTIIAGTLTFSLCNYFFPELSRQHSAGERDNFCQTVRTGLGSSAAILMPFFAAVLLLAGEGVSILYLRGEFDASAANGTASVLRMIALGMPAFAVVEIGSRVFYAMEKVRVPMLAAVSGIAANLISSFVLTRFSPLGVPGVGLGNAVGLTTAACVIIIMMIKNVPEIFSREFCFRLLKTLACALLSALVMAIIFIVTRYLGGGAYERGIIANIGVCMAVFVPGAAVYLILIKYFKIIK